MNLTERRKRLQELKEQGENGNSAAKSVATGSTNYSSSRAKRLDEIKQAERQERLSAVSSELTSRVDTWFKNNENYINNYNSRFSGVTGSYSDPYDADISNWVSTVTAQKSNFDKEAASIKSIIEENKDYLNSDWVNEVFSAFDSASKVQSDIINASNSLGEYWSQWESADAYNEWQKYRSTIDPILNADDFEEYFAAGEAKGVKAKWNSDVENNVAYLRNPDILALYESSAKSSNGASFGTVENVLLNKINYKAAKYMTDEEYKVYNYYVGKGDTEKAESYLKSLEETLTRRQAGDIVSEIKGNPLKEAYFALESGADQFWSGIGNIDNFIMGAENDLLSATQMASPEIREGIKGGWGVAYDLAQTTANMLPSILVGTFAGGLSGAITLGASATGNAYSQMMELGYDKGQARTYATLVGASETALSYALGGISKLGGGGNGIFQTVASKIVPKLDNAIARIAIEIGGNMLDEGLEEAIQEVLDPIFKMAATGEDFEGIDLEQVLYSGLLGALSGGLLEGIPTIAGNAISSYDTNRIYRDIAQDIVTESLEIDPNNAHAQRMQAKIDAGKNVSGYQINRLIDANENAMYNNDIATIQKAAENRLSELGERGDVKAIAAALTKQAMGESLSLSERQAIKKSSYGQRVANELNTENIRSGAYSSAWAENLNTDRINADVYGKMVAELEAQDAAPNYVNLTKEQIAADRFADVAKNNGSVTEATVSKMEQVQNEADSLQVTGKLPASKTDIATNNDHIPDTTKKVETAQTAEPTVASEAAVREVETESATNETPEVKEASEGKVEASKADNSVTLEAASKAYGAQAGAMIHTYAEGQDVAQYDAAYRAAYDMGKSGVGLSYAMQSEATAYLTEKQRELAHAAGVDASAATAKDLDAKNKAAANGKTGRRKGVVKGDNVTLDELRATFNDTQNIAYKLLSTYAEATGVNIVLYKSEANADGKFEGAQGRFKWSEDTIYIDINAGLANIKGVNDLAKYTMVRTFSHEFSHFLEKWNPIWYNELRKVVFDTITEQGENVDSLIAVKMEQTGLDYDQASREVVAEALTDILPDATFVETLATKHKNVFEKLLEKLKEFLADLKAYFSSIGPNSAREANALKEQIGDTVKYFENVVTLFDRVAVEAVENYQMTVAMEEVAINTETETVSETVEEVSEEAVAETEKVEETAAPEAEATEEAAKVEAPAKTEAAPAEADTRPIEEIEKEYKRKFSSWLKRSVRQYVFNYGGATFLSNGAFGLRASKEMVNLARSEFVGQVTETDIPDAAVRALENSTLITEAPLEGTAGGNTFYAFNINGKKQAYDKKMLSKLDGNLLYIGDFVKGAMMIKAVDTDGNMVGFLMPVKLGSEVTDTKPSKLKSFSNKFLSQISNQEVKANGEEAGTVLPHRSDGQGDSRLLAESQTEDVQGDGAERNAVDDSRERGNEAGRSDMRPDAEGSRGRSGEGDRESADLRRDDRLTPEAEKLHEEVAEQIEQKSTEQPKGRNFVIGESLDLPSGEKARYKANVEAIRLVKQLETEGRYATEAEQIVLSKYVGWGGLANAFDQRKSEWAKEYAELKEILSDEEYASARGSTLNAHYTDISVIKAMYDGLAALGFEGGRLLEPSAGVGNFVGAMPAEMSAKVKSWTMVELDGITGLIAKYLYPNADVRIQGFEKAIIPDSYMDVAISNVPFGDYPIADKAYPKKVTKAIHNYFFAKSLDKVRPGGIVMFITSSYTMNSKDSTVRRYIMQRADLIGAIRLPDSAFKGNAGTEVVTDIIVLKKRADNTPYAGEDFLEATYRNISGYNGAYINGYFDAHPEMVLGTATMDGGMYRGNTLTYKALEGKGSLGDQIREAFKSIKGKMDYTAAPSREKTNFAVERAGKKTKENGLVVKDGKVYQNRGGELIEQTVAKGAAERISGMLDIRDAARELMTYQQQGLNDTEIRRARTKLNRAYDAFVKKYGYINSQANKTAIKDDPDKFSIFALENYDSEKKTATKADIFSKNTVAPNRTVTSAKDVSEGLIVSINQTVGELLENPERFTVNDVLRAWDAYDSNNAARDEDYTKEELIEGLRAENERMIEDGDGSLEDLTFKARIPFGEVGQIVNRANNRTYAVYANVTNPYIINARQHTLAGANLYPAIEAGMSAAEYDGVIVRNARVGAHQETGDVVIIKESGQVKLTSNKTPTPHSDISYQQRTDTLTDREVLQVAAEKLAGEKKKVGGEVVDALDEGEKAALEIFTKRLGALELLEEERAKQGRLYKEQQFGAKVDRAAAAETLNRMHILDDKIKAANAEVLALENKEILGRVLKKARKVIEVEQRAHDDEIFKRYVDRAKNAAAIKKYRERIKADVDDLTSWVLSPNNKDITKHVPDVIKNSVIPFLESIDFTSKQQLRGGEATKADTEFVKKLSGLEAALKENIEAEGLYSGYTDLPPFFMERLNDFIRLVRELTDQKSGEFVINKMTSEELRELAGVVKVLKAYITQMNKFHANAMFAHVWEAGDSTIAALSEMGNNGGEANAASNFVFWQQIRPAYAFERFGEGGKAIYDGLRRGQAQLAFNTQKIVDFTEKAYTDKEVKAWEKEIKNIRISAGTVKMRVSDIMSFYELSKQRDSLRHMLGEGMRVATYTADGKKISDNGHALNEGDIAIIIGTLTERQKQVADALQKYMAEQGGAWGNYVSVARFGEELFGNPEYFPINSDGRHLQATADEYPSNASLYALLNMSFTKARNEEAKNRIVVYSIFDVFANHMASMAQYNAMALPVLDAIKWFNYQQKTEDANGERYFKDGVREQMDRVYGVPEETRPGRGRGGYAQSFVLNIIKAFNGTEAQGVPTDTFGMNAMRHYNMAQIAYNFRVVVQQPLAVTRAALLIDYGSIMKGMKLSPAAIKKNVAEMREHSGIAAWKALGFYDVNISRGLTDTIKHSSTLMQNIGEVGMKGAEWADTVTWAAMWSACKEEVIKKQRLRPSDAGFYEAVTKLFEDVVYKTQVVDSILTKNEFMRSKGFFARAIGSFMSEPATTASMLIDAVDKYNADLKRGMDKSQAWEKNKRMIGRTIYVYAVSATLLAAVQAVADAWRDDDDYETFLEKWLEAFGGNIVDELMPLNKLPILSDFYDVAKELLSIFGVDTYGNPPQSVFMQWYDSLIKGTEIIYDKIAGKDTNYTWYGGIYKLLQALSGMIGAPMAATTREVVAIWNNIIGAMAPSLKVKTYDAGETNELKYAYADGYLTFEEAVNELVEQGLVDNEDEAYFTVSGWEAGEGYSRYDAIYDAVLNGGDFDAAMDELTSHGYTEKDVMKQIKSQIGTWYSDDKSDVRVSKQQAIAMLEKYTDLTDEEITKTVNRWSSKVVTGIAYDDIDEAFLEGKISAARASEMYQRYGGLTTEAAGEKVAVLKFIKDYPQFEAGDVSYSMVEGFLGYGESAGIDVNVFYDVWKYNTTAKADVDKNGKAISGSKKEKVLDYIDSLPLSKKQKDSLYYALGWAESTIREAPWR